MRSGKSTRIKSLTARRPPPSDVVRGDYMLTGASADRLGVCEEPSETPAMSLLG